MESNQFLRKKRCDSVLICLVCGDVARGVNFNVISCVSCRSFFRRHVLGNTKQCRCINNNECIIKLKSRNECSACRLQKCFSVGMNTKLMRAQEQTSDTSENQQLAKINQNTWLPQPTTLSLLLKDRSTLTFDDWNLLSNIIHAYDDQNIVTKIRSSLRELFSLPPKLRSKKPLALESIFYCFSSIQSFLERTTYFHNLTIDIRRLLMYHNLNGIGSLNSYFVACETQVFDDEYVCALCNNIYGKDYITESRRLVRRMETNATLVKMMIMILGFSTNCSIVLPEHRLDSIKMNSWNSITLSRIQDKFITLLWKYLVYQYGFSEAVRRLNYLVKNYLDILNRINENNSKQHMNIVEFVIEKTTNSLTLND